MVRNKSKDALPRVTSEECKKTLLLRSSHVNLTSLQKELKIHPHRKIFMALAKALRIITKAVAKAFAMGPWIIKNTNVI